jgi:Cdc6-like AAA superfamily ATPase
METSLTNTLLRLPKRAEASAREKLIETFVDVGPLFALLSSSDHQVLFGRRGTGKTHALAYLADSRENSGDVVAMIDLRNVGSSTGLYADATVPLAERATRLLVDTLSAIHEVLYQSSLRTPSPSI